MTAKVYLFWDNSNIFIPAKSVADRREKGFASSSVRIQFDNLYALARAGREVAKGFCVGSVPPELEHVWERLRETGIEIELYERGRGSGTEQAVDQALQVHMLRTLADVKVPETAVLLTGDGAGFDNGVGFHADLKRMADAGWGVEVLSWDAACRRALKEWARSSGVYVRLDDYYESITFLEKLRPSQTLSLKSRRLATPRSLAPPATV